MKGELRGSCGKIGRVRTGVGGDVEPGAARAFDGMTLRLFRYLKKSLKTVTWGSFFVIAGVKGSQPQRRRGKTSDVNRVP